MQGSQLGKTIDDFSHPDACITPSGTKKAMEQEDTEKATIHALYANESRCDGTEWIDFQKVPDGREDRRQTSRNLEAAINMWLPLLLGKK